MGIALTLQNYLEDRHVDYGTLTHRFADTATECAETAHISGERMAKAVILKDDEGYLMAVLPATYHVDFDTLRQRLGRDVQLVDEDELKPLFDDCEIGAIPPLGVAYGLHSIVETSLVEKGDLYFEAGDHKTLVHMQAEAFGELLGAAERGRFGFHD